MEKPSFLTSFKRRFQKKKDPRALLMQSIGSEAIELIRNAPNYEEGNRILEEATRRVEQVYIEAVAAGPPPVVEKILSEHLQDATLFEANYQETFNDSARYNAVREVRLHNGIQSILTHNQASSEPNQGNSPSQGLEP